MFYTGYALVATVFFLYALFPADAALAYLSGYLGKHYPEYTVAADTVAPAFPPGFKLRDVTIGYRGETWMDFEQLRIRPHYLSLFSSRKTVRFAGKAYEGDTSGRIDLQKADTGYRMTAAVELEGLLLEQHEYLQALSGRKIAGRMGGTLYYGRVKGREKSLDIRLRVEDGEVGLTNPVFSISNVEFDTIEADLVVDRRSLKLKRCDIAGEQVNGEFKGVVLFRQPFERSRLEFKGNVVPQPPLMASLKKVVPENLLPSTKPGGKGFPVKLYGTVDNPKFSLR